MRWDEEHRLFAEIVAENDDIRMLRDSLAGQPPEATQYERIQLGERVAAALQRKSEAAWLLDTLAPLAVETRVNKNLSAMMLLNAAFLQVSADEYAAQEAALLAQLNALRAELRGDTEDVGGS